MTNAAPSRRSTRSPRHRGADASRSPLDELRAEGHLGPVGAALLYRAVRSIAVRHGFPPSSPQRAWDTEAVTEVAHEFLADARTPQRLAYLLVHALDDRAFERLLHRMVLNFLRDLGRRTEVGRLMLRLRDVLADSDDFVVEPGGRWRLATQPSTPSTVASPVLAHAAAAEPHVDVPRWSPQTRRRPPAADAASLQRLCRRVLAAGNGTVPLDQLAFAVAPRLGLAPAPLAQPVDDRDPLDSIAAPHRADSGLDGMRASEIFAALTDRERLLLSAAGTPVRELRSVVGLGPSQAAEVQSRLRELLATELRDDDSYETVIFHLIDQAKTWARTRASGHGRAIPRLVKTT
jgi:hypothetical protein